MQSDLLAARHIPSGRFVRELLKLHKLKIRGTFRCLIRNKQDLHFDAAADLFRFTQKIQRTSAELKIISRFETPTWFSAQHDEAQSSFTQFK